MKMPLGLKGMDLKNIDLRDKSMQFIIFAVLITLIVFFLYIWFIFFPHVLRVHKLIGETVKIKDELISAKDLAASEGSVRKRLEEYREKVELYEKKLPAEQEIPNLLEDLSGMAKDSNITIIGIKPSFSYLKGQGLKTGQVYQEIPILITAKSGYHELGKLLSSLENAGRFIKVVDIGVKANKANPRKHDIELMVCTYMLPHER